MIKVFYLLIFMTYIGCLPKPVQNNLEQSDVAKNDQEVVQIYIDEPDPSDEGSSLPLDIIIPESNISMELSSVKQIPVKIKAQDTFQNSSIEVYVDYGDLLGFSINAGDYIKTSLSRQRIFLSAGQEIELMLSIDVKSMAPSFNSISEGGDGKIIIRAVGNQGSGQRQSEKVIGLKVNPILTIGILTKDAPYSYDQPNQIYTRAHDEGLQVVFVNKVPGFGDDGMGPCIHTTAPLKHCNVNERMKPGDTYLPPKVLPSKGLRQAVFYDHFESDDSIGRYIHFNVVPGMEEQ